MEQVRNGQFTGERALYGVRDLQIFNSAFFDGESPLKHARNLQVTDSDFKWKYPLWHSEDVTVTGGTFFEGARAGIWYTNNITLKNVDIQAPKNFRRCDGVVIENCSFADAQETLWNCKNVTLKNVKAAGNYLAMNATDLKIENLTLDGNYPFDGCKNVEVRNSRLLSKDAFWNCENVTIYDSYISGEYFGWNSKNVTLINCTVDSNQGFCYIENLVLKNCQLENTDLAFEYSSVDAEICGKVVSVKNPASGKITAEEIGELIIDENKIDFSRTQVNCPVICKKTFGATDPVSL